MRLLLSLTCLATLAISISAQEKGTSPNARPRAVPEVRELSFEAAAEKLVRAAYAKLTRYNKASLIENERRYLHIPLEERYLRFELSNFSGGPIQEILNLPHNEVQTIATEVVQLGRSVHTLNNADPHVAYSAEWIIEQYAPLYNPKWTVNELFSHEIATYSDVGAYVKYDVTLRLHGKVRSYNAVTLFRNPYGSVEDLKPLFWDIVVGSAGAFDSLWYERRPAVGEPSKGEQKLQPEKSEKTVPGTQTFSSADYSTFAKTPIVTSRLITPLTVTETSSDTISLGPVVTSTTQDYTEHSAGSHGETIQFQGSCEAPSITQQTCRVNFFSVYIFENGRLKNLVYVHKNLTDQSEGTSSGPRGTPITCHSGYGVATKNCLSKSCTFSATLVGSGASMTMTGGDVWRGQVVHGHTCNIPASGGGGGGACNEAPTQFVKSATSAPAPNLVNPYCCDAVEQFNCINGGGEWSDATCSCYSPILIDVAGNGFDLTDAAGGVMFDLTATGTEQQVSWTSTGSDDALLVLDRNGNSLIDNGRELFGSSTPQPYLSPGEEKNGFRALAVFDRPENGGNGDGQIDARDSVFSNLKLWQDTNHNGVSEGDELRSLASSEIQMIDLNYRDARRRDENGNWFRYRAKVGNVQGAQVGRWAWDVFLQKVH